jgi:hypothetical protein
VSIGFHESQIESEPHHPSFSILLAHQHYIRILLFFVFSMIIQLIPGHIFADDDFSADLMDGSMWRYLEYAR